MDRAAADRPAGSGPAVGLRPLIEGRGVGHSRGNLKVIRRLGRMKFYPRRVLFISVSLDTGLIFRGRSSLTGRLASVREHARGCQGPLDEAVDGAPGRVVFVSEIKVWARLGLAHGVCWSTFSAYAYLLRRRRPKQEQSAQQARGRENRSLRCAASRSGRQPG